METLQVKGYFTNEDKFIPKGEYKPTSVDEYKASVDFLILSCGNRYAISFNKPIELKCNRSISRANCGGYVYYVTDKALAQLKQQYSWSCDF